MDGEDSPGIKGHERDFKTNTVQKINIEGNYDTQGCGENKWVQTN